MMEEKGKRKKWNREEESEIQGEGRRLRHKQKAHRTEAYLCRWEAALGVAESLGGGGGGGFSFEPLGFLRWFPEPSDPSNHLWPHLTTPGGFYQGPSSPKTRIYSTQTLMSKRQAVLEKHSCFGNNNV